jgi:hypothetical protein|nr:MAG TPA: hypothetical protein [Caudoviricetes sp.]
MIKVETIGMIDNAVLNSVLQSAKEVANYQFITDDGDTYLVCNTIAGDDAYIDDVKFAAGEYLNGYNVKAWEGQKLVVDDKHIAYDSEKTYADLVAGTTLLTVNAEGKLAVASVAPESGVYFKVTDKCRLTGNAVKVKVCVA